MPIPFVLSEELETLGEAAFLRLEPQRSDREMRGALLFLNALGEPKEFVYNRIRLDAADTLWNPGDRRRGAARRLIVSLFDTAQGWPRLVFGQADRVGPELFGGDRLIALDLPVARLALLPSHGLAADAVFSLETFDARGDALRLRADWAAPLGPPAEDSAGGALLALLAVRGLLWEPFERASAGLQEAYGDG